MPPQPKSPPERRSCPVCNADDTAPSLHRPGLQLVRCRGCGMVYLADVPAEYASGEYYDHIGQEYYLSPDKLESDYAPVRFQRELRLFRRYCTRGRVLDVGCSSGAFLYQLAHQFPGSFETLGTDVSGPALDYAASRGVPIQRGEFLDQDFGAQSFDAVTLWAVLEHLANPHAFIEKSRSILKPAGLCFVLVPNLNSLAVRLLGARYRYIYPQHLNYFTRATLTRLCTSGFAIIAARTTHFNPIVIWQDWRRAGADVSNLERGQLLRRTTRYKQNPWLLPARLLYRFTEATLSVGGLADNLVLVLRKN